MWSYTEHFHSPVTAGSQGQPVSQTYYYFNAEYLLKHGVLFKFWPCHSLLAVNNYCNVIQSKMTEKDGFSTGVITNSYTMTEPRPRNPHY